MATRQITQDDVFIAPTCDWFYPNGISKPSKDHYRIPELQRIMDAAERNPKQVQEFKEWQRQQDEVARGVEIDRAPDPMSE